MLTDKFLVIKRNAMIQKQINRNVPFCIIAKWFNTTIDVIVAIATNQAVGLEIPAHPKTRPGYKVGKRGNKPIPRHHRKGKHEKAKRRNNKSFA